MVELELPVSLLDRRVRQERHQVGFDAHRAGAGATPSVGRGEGLVQVHMNRVEAHVAGPADAHKGVEIGPVVVQHRPRGVDHLRNIQYLALEQAQGVGVRQHQGRNPGRQLGLEVGQADPAVRP